LSYSGTQNGAVNLQVPLRHVNFIRFDFWSGRDPRRPQMPLADRENGLANSSAARRDF